MQAAVDLAKESDVVVIVAGLTSEWEAEGSDRTTADLPGRQHELIEKVDKVQLLKCVTTSFYHNVFSQVAAANPKTVVVVQAVGNITILLRLLRSLWV